MQVQVEIIEDKQPLLFKRPRGVQMSINAEDCKILMIIRKSHLSKERKQLPNLILTKLKVENQENQENQISVGKRVVCDC